MASEAAFVKRTIDQITPGFIITKIEQKYTRAFPDLWLMNVNSINMALIEMKIADKRFADFESINERVTIKSLTAHQINWISSRAKVGGLDRTNIGVMLYLDPFVLYIPGDKISLWRGGVAPSLRVLFREGASGAFYKTVPCNGLKQCLWGRGFHRDEGIEGIEELINSNSNMDILMESVLQMEDRHV